MRICCICYSTAILLAYFIEGTLENVPKLSHGGSAIAVTLRSVAKINSNYICGSAAPTTYGLSSFSGISCMDSNMTAKSNLILNCSRHQITQANHINDKTLEDNDHLSTLGLHTGIFVKHRAKLELIDNFVQRCDVGIYVGRCQRVIYQTFLIFLKKNIL